MSDQNLFGKEEQPQETPAQQEPASSDNVFADQLASIKNERGEQKYASVEEALKGSANAQQYITELKGKLSSYEEEMAKIKSELEKRESVEDVVSRLTAQQEPKVEETPDTPASDGQDINQVVEQLLTQREAASKKAQNVELVQSTLTKQFGDKTREVVQAKAKELGIAPERIGEIAAESPQMALALFNTTQSKNPGSTSALGSQRVPADYAPKESELGRPANSLLSGATSKEQAEYMRKIQEHVYNKLGVTQ